MLYALYILSVQELATGAYAPRRHRRLEHRQGCTHGRRDGMVAAQDEGRHASAQDELHGLLRPLQGGGLVGVDDVLQRTSIGALKLMTLTHILISTIYTVKQVYHMSFSLQ